MGGMRKRLLWIAALYIVVIGLFIGLTPKEIVWKDIFTGDSNKPYGSEVFFNSIEDSFDSIQVESRSLYSIVKADSTDTTKSYFFQTNFFSLSEAEMHNLLDWVAEGHDAFISANDFSFTFLDTLNLTSEYAYFGIDALSQSDLQVGIGDTMNEPLQRFTFKKQANLMYLSTLHDSLEVPAILSVAKNPNTDKWNFPILVRQSFGKGSFYLHTLPYSFTNYYLLYGNTAEYCSEMISYLPPDQLIWDNYYKPQGGQKKPILSVFTSQAPFKWALILGVSLILLYMLFKLKRTQRIIPTINPPANRSLEFTKTIGDLYYHTGDHLDLVQKMELHFKEYLKEKLFIYNYTGSSEDMQYLASKSGKTIGLVSSITTMMNHLKKGNISHTELIRLSQKLHQFYYGRTE